MLIFSTFILHVHINIWLSLEKYTNIKYIFFVRLKVR